MPDKKKKEADITITISGKEGTGKRAIKGIIAAGLKNKPLGYFVYVEDDENSLDGTPEMLAASSYDFPAKPDWDGQVRTIAIQVEDKD